MADAPMTAERLDAIEESARQSGSAGLSATVLNLVDEVRRLQKLLANADKRLDEVVEPLQQVGQEVNAPLGVQVGVWAADEIRRLQAALDEAKDLEGTMQGSAYSCGFDHATAQEREACARVADEAARVWNQRSTDDHGKNAERAWACGFGEIAAQSIAAEIRARGDKYPTAGMGPATKHGEADPEPVGKPTGDNQKHPPPSASATFFPCNRCKRDDRQTTAHILCEDCAPDGVCEHCDTVLAAVRAAIRALDYMVPDPAAALRILREVLG